jgi:hypothetical protein
MVVLPNVPQNPQQALQAINGQNKGKSQRFLYRTTSLNDRRQWALQEPSLEYWVLYLNSTTMTLLHS